MSGNLVFVLATIVLCFIFGIILAEKLGRKQKHPEWRDNGNGTFGPPPTQVPWNEPVPAWEPPSREEAFLGFLEALRVFRDEERARIAELRQHSQYSDYSPAPEPIKPLGFQEATRVFRDEERARIRNLEQHSQYSEPYPQPVAPQKYERSQRPEESYSPAQSTDYDLWHEVDRGQHSQYPPSRPTRTIREALNGRYIPEMPPQAGLLGLGDDGRPLLFRPKGATVDISNNITPKDDPALFESIRASQKITYQDPNHEPEFDTRARRGYRRIGSGPEHVTIEKRTVMQKYGDSEYPETVYTAHGENGSVEFRPFKSETD